MITTGVPLRYTSNCGPWRKQPPARPTESQSAFLRGSQSGFYACEGFGKTSLRPPPTLRIYDFVKYVFLFYRLLEGPFLHLFLFDMIFIMGLTKDLNFEILIRLLASRET